MAKSKIYTDIDTLHTIDTELLIKLINKFNDYFTDYAVIDQAGNINYENLRNALLKLKSPNENEIPDELLDILHSIAEMSSSEQSDELLEEIGKEIPEYLLKNDKHSPIDIALFCRW